MIQIAGNIGSSTYDAEYMRIIQELRRLGLSSSGDKDKDTQKLAEAKAELIDKIKSKGDTENNNISLGVQTIEEVDPSEYARRTEMEEQRLGAMNIAELNKLYFGLL